MTTEAIIEILRSNRDDLGRTKLIEAASALAEEMAPQWYYPEKGELPTYDQMVFFQLGHLAPKMVLPGRYFNGKFWWLVFEKNRPRITDCENVIRWTPFLIPQPPAQ